MMFELSMLSLMFMIGQEKEHILLMDVQKAVTLDLDLISTLQIYALNIFEPM